MPPGVRVCRPVSGRRRVEDTAVVVDEGLEPFDHGAVAPFAERTFEPTFGAPSPPGQLVGQLRSGVGRVKGSAPAVAGVGSGLHQTGVDEGRGDPLHVHGVGAQRSGQLTDAMTRVRGDDPHEGGLRCGDTEVGQLGLPGPAVGPMGHPEEEAEPSRGHVSPFRGHVLSGRRV
jgi:hypothetical protein